MNKPNYFLGSLLIILIMLLFSMGSMAEILIVVLLANIVWILGEINLKMKKNKKGGKK